MYHPVTEGFIERTHPKSQPALNWRKLSQKVRKLRSSVELKKWLLVKAFNILIVIKQAPTVIATVSNGHSYLMDDEDVDD